MLLVLEIFHKFCAILSLENPALLGLHYQISLTAVKYNNRIMIIQVLVHALLLVYLLFLNFSLVIIAHFPFSHTNGHDTSTGRI